MSGRREARKTASATELTRIMGLLPNRAAIKLVRRMAAIDPSPEYNSRRPRTWSSTPTRTLAKSVSAGEFRVNRAEDPSRQHRRDRNLHPGCG